MKTMLYVSIAAVGLVACGGGDPTEKTGQSEQHYDASCMANIKAPIGSQEWRDEVRACALAPSPGKTAPAPAPAPPPDPTDPGADPGDPGAGGGSACQISTTCVNSICTCGSGPNKGVTCDGAAASGPGSCNDLCSFCQ